MPLKLPERAYPKGIYFKGDLRANAGGDTTGKWRSLGGHSAAKVAFEILQQTYRHFGWGESKIPFVAEGEVDLEAIRAL